MEADLQDKLNEAKFFLQKMEDSTSQTDPFRYYLSAFLNAAYSLIELMRKHAEVKKNPEADKWVQAELSNIKHHEYLNVQRRLATHHRPAKSKGSVDVYEHDESGAISIVYYLTGTASTLRILRPLLPNLAPKVIWYFEDFTDEDVISISEKWVQGLEEMLKKFLIKFRR